MPTKERRAKERARELEEKRLDEILAPLAEQFDNADLTLNEIAIKAARPYNTNLIKFYENGQPYRVALHPEKPSNDERADERRAEALRLKQKYPDKWGVRSWAKWIAGKEDLGARAIQKYFKDFP